MAETLLLCMHVFFYNTACVILLCSIVEKSDMIWKGEGVIANYNTVQDFKYFNSSFESVIN